MRGHGVHSVVLVALIVTAGVSRGDVPPAYLAAAHALNVPPKVLFAVALTESGTRFSSGDTRPWPWSLNVAGASKYFPTREAAHAALVEALTHGQRNVDVGLMQINWRWHGERLLDPWNALDPKINLTVGAILLREAYDALGKWPQAIGRYHSHRRAHAARYRARVLRRLRALEGRGS